MQRENHSLTSAWTTSRTRWRKPLPRGLRATGFRRRANTRELIFNEDRAADKRANVLACEFGSCESYAKHEAAKKETVTTIWRRNESESAENRDCSRACIPRVYHNRRKCAVNLTATTMLGISGRSGRFALYSQYVQIVSQHGHVSNARRVHTRALHRSALVTW